MLYCGKPRWLGVLGFPGCRSCFSWAEQPLWPLIVLWPSGAFIAIGRSMSRNSSSLASLLRTDLGRQCSSWRLSNLRRWRRWAIPRVIVIVVGSAIAADLVKLLVTRDRPYHFDFSGGVWQTFGQWFSLANIESVHQSFPSAHTAVAVSLAIALTWHYPRGWWLFSALAFLAACQRLQSSAHYLSDVLFAAAVGSAVAVVCLCIGPVPRWFDRREASWKPRVPKHSKDD